MKLSLAGHSKLQSNVAKSGETKYSFRSSQLPYVTSKTHKLISCRILNIDSPDHAELFEPRAPELFDIFRATRSIDAALSALESDYVDSVLVGGSLLTDDKILLGVWEGLEVMMLEEKVRQLGITGVYDVDRLVWLRGNVSTEIVILRNDWIVGRAGAFINGETREWCKDNQVIYQYVPYHLKFESYNPGIIRTIYSTLINSEYDGQDTNILRRAHMISPKLPQSLINGM